MVLGILTGCHHLFCCFNLIYELNKLEQMPQTAYLLPLPRAFAKPLACVLHKVHYLTTLQIPLPRGKSEKIMFTNLPMRWGQFKKGVFPRNWMKCADLFTKVMSPSLHPCEGGMKVKVHFKDCFARHYIKGVDLHRKLMFVNRNPWDGGGVNNPNVFSQELNEMFKSAQKNHVFNSHPVGWDRDKVTKNIC